jgi:probable HAF family extracellular repeat protein
MKDLGTLGGLQSSAAAINASGQVVGYSDNNNPNSPEVHAFLYKGGSMQDLGTLGGTYSSALGINNGGQVVGFSLTSGNDFHAFLYANGSMSDLGTLGGTGSQAYAINTAGVIVGNASTSSGATDAFVDSKGVMTDLNSLINPNSGWVLQGATSINDAGQIVGMGTIDLGAGLGVQTHAFLLTPQSVPEPSSLMLIILGTVGVTSFQAIRRAAKTRLIA